MSPDLKVGLRHMLSIRVDERLTVPAVPAVSPAFAGFANMPPVFATSFMIGFIECACLEALRPYLDPGERTVGTHVDVSHLAATPVGMTVVAEVELVEIQGRKLRFKVSCRDNADVISTGFHERAVIDYAKFTARVAEKAAKAAHAH